jgi:hypothetical protein
MNYALLIWGIAIIDFGGYLLYDEYKNWAEMKQKAPGRLYKSVLFGIMLMAVGVIALVKGFMGQSIH